MVLLGVRFKKQLPRSARKAKSFRGLFTAATVVRHAHSWNCEGGRCNASRLHPYYGPRLQRNCASFAPM